MNESTYIVVGTDGKNYGPITATQLREWIAQSRVDSRTPVLIQGATEWTYVGLLPELAALFAGHPPVMTALKGPVAGYQPTNGFALWGMICGLLAWCTCGCCFPFAIAGLTFSIIGLVQVNGSNQAQTGRGLAIAGIVLSGSNLLWAAGYSIFRVSTEGTPMFINFN